MMAEDKGGTQIAVTAFLSTTNLKSLAGSDGQTVTVIANGPGGGFSGQAVLGKTDGAFGARGLVPLTINLTKTSTWTYY